MEDIRTPLERWQRWIDEPDIISVPETARRIHVHSDTLYRWCRNGEFEPAVKLGARRWMVSVPKLERYLHGQG